MSTKPLIYCDKPFTTILFDVQGNVIPCICPMTKMSLGKYLECGNSLDALWNSKNAIEIRRSIAEQTFEHCPIGVCKACGLAREIEPDGGEAAELRKWKARGYRSERGPTYFAMNYDDTCNLYCLSCRDKKHVMEAEQRRRVLEFQDALFAQNAFDGSTLHVSQNGDPFASPIYMRLLRRLRAENTPIRGLILQTNGMGLTPKIFDELFLNWEKLLHVSISVDAATPETYARLRRGGDFAALMANIEHLRRHFPIHPAKKGEYPLVFNFVIQQGNYKEVIPFIRLAARFEAYALFTVMSNWYMSEELYQAQAIQLPNHPEHDAFLEIMNRDEIVNSDDTVVLHYVNEYVGRGPRSLEERLASQSAPQPAPEAAKRRGLMRRALGRARRLLS